MLENRQSSTACHFIQGAGVMLIQVEKNPKTEIIINLKLEHRITRGKVKYITDELK